MHLCWLLRNKEAWRLYDPATGSFFASRSVYFAEDFFDYEGIHFDGEEVELASITEAKTIPKIRLPVSALASLKPKPVSSKTLLLSIKSLSSAEKTEIDESISPQNGQLNHGTTDSKSMSQRFSDRTLLSKSSLPDTKFKNDSIQHTITDESASGDLEPFNLPANLSIFRGKKPSEPTTFAEAQRLPESALWLQACDEELLSLYENSTWTLVPAPSGKNVVGCKWVFNNRP